MIGCLLITKKQRFVTHTHTEITVHGSHMQLPDCMYGFTVLIVLFAKSQLPFATCRKTNVNPQICESKNPEYKADIFYAVKAEQYACGSQVMAGGCGSKNVIALEK